MFGVTPGAHLSWLLFLAIAAAIVVWFLIRRTRLGYEARAVGSSPGSARAGGVSIGSTQLRLFLISGALAGLIGMQLILADRGYLPLNYVVGLGFTGIAVAFLGQNNPIGIIFAAILWAILSRGEVALQISSQVPREFIIILQGLLILTVVITYQIAKRRLAARQLQRAGMAGDAGGLGRARTESAGPRGPEDTAPRRSKPADEKRRLMPFTDIAVAIQISFTYFTILYLTGLGGLFSERSGIVNIGLEGLMIIGTVTGAFGARFFTDTVGLGTVWGPILGLLFGALCGAIFASMHAVATITFRVDHIVSGVVINLVAIGLARFLSYAFFNGQSTQSDPGGPHLARLDIPGLSSLPGGLDRAFQGLSPMVVVAALMVIPVWYSLYRTRWGLRLRSCGENPEATRSLGVSVPRYRYQGVLLSGAFAGAFGRVPGGRDDRELAGGPDAGPGVHRPRGADHLELEPDPADVLRVAVRVRLRDPAPVARRARDLVAPRTVHPDDPVRRHDRGDRRLRRSRATSRGRRPGVRGRRGELAGYSVPNSRSPKSPSPGTMYPRSFSWRSIAAVKIGTSG